MFWNKLKSTILRSRSREHKISEWFILVLLFLILINPGTNLDLSDLSGASNDIKEIVDFNGEVVGEDLTSQELNSLKCREKGSHEILQYIGACVEGYTLPESIDRVTVAVYDSALSVAQWQLLENNGIANIDIVRYVLPTERTSILGLDRKYLYEISEWGSVGVDDEESLHSIDFGLNSGTVDHGFSVLSALALVARNVKVVYFPAGNDMNQGFSLFEHGLYDWIYDNADRYDIDIFTTSLTARVFYESGGQIPFDSRNFQRLHEKGIIPFIASGNDGIKDNSVSMKIDDYNYRIGGIASSDGPHIELDKYGNEKEVFGANVVKNRWHGDHTPLGASYGGMINVEGEEGSIIDFSMPYWGIPIQSQFYSDSDDNIINDFGYRYGRGTSLATPMLAGAAAVAIERYADLYYDKIGKERDPNVTEVYNMLKQASHHSYFEVERDVVNMDGQLWNQKVGYGTPSINVLSNLAEELAKDRNQSPDLDINFENEFMDRSTGSDKLWVSGKITLFSNDYYYVLNTYIKIPSIALELVKPGRFSQFDTNKLEDGKTYTIIFGSIDFDGNINEQTLEVSIDNAAPKIVNIYLDRGDNVYSGRFQAIYIVDYLTIYSGIDYLEYYLEGFEDQKKLLDISNPWFVGLDKTSYLDGDYKLVVTIYNNLNSSGMGDLDINIDKSPPPVPDFGISTGGSYYIGYSFIIMTLLTIITLIPTKIRSRFP
jgi:hypothetical protein